MVVKELLLALLSFLVVVSSTRLRRLNQCPFASDTFTLAPHNPPHETGSHDFNRVVMADYPSTGSTWLRKLMTAVAESSGECASPSCTIYGDNDHCLVSEPGVKCPCATNWTAEQGALFFKTHVPAQAQFRDKPLSGWQYDASSHFDKMLYLVRHPVPTVKSNIRRWGGLGGLSGKLAENIRCWGTWWERASAAVGDANVHIMRYEDLCLNTAKTLHSFLQFLGGCYTRISQSAVQSALDQHPKLKCYYAHNLGSLTAVTSWNDHQVVNTLANLMTKWGYSTSHNEFASFAAAVNMAAVDAVRSLEENNTMNPWSGVWSD